MSFFVLRGVLANCLLQVYSLESLAYLCRLFFIYFLLLDIIYYEPDRQMCSECQVFQLSCIVIMEMMTQYTENIL